MSTSPHPIDDHINRSNEPRMFNEPRKASPSHREQQESGNRTKTALGHHCNQRSPGRNAPQLGPNARNKRATMDDPDGVSGLG
jgi:hypothetical protein